MTNLLRISGLPRERGFVNDRRVLNRAAWSPRAASRLLLGLLVAAIVAAEPLVLGINDTIERRWSRRIGAKGIYRDPVRPSHSHVVRASGLHWLSLMLLVPIPWAGQVRALPRLRPGPVRACRPRAWLAAQETDRLGPATGAAGTALVAGARPGVLVGDSGSAGVELLDALGRQSITCITRLRFDAALCEPAAVGTKGWPRSIARGDPPAEQPVAEPPERSSPVDPVGHPGPA